MEPPGLSQRPLQFFPTWKKQQKNRSPVSMSCDFGSITAPIPKAGVAMFRDEKSTWQGSLAPRGGSRKSCRRLRHGGPFGSRGWHRGGGGLCSIRKRLFSLGISSLGPEDVDLASIKKGSTYFPGLGTWLWMRGSASPRDLN